MNHRERVFTIIVVFALLVLNEIYGAWRKWRDHE